VQREGCALRVHALRDPRAPAHRWGRRRGVRRTGIVYVRSTESERDGEPETGGYDSTFQRQRARPDG